MKKTDLFRISVFIFITTTIVFFLTTTGCKKDKCEETAEPEYELGIKAEVTVKDLFGDPVGGHNVLVSMQKTHCTGFKGPDLISEGQTESNGIYFPANTWSFKMNNSEDYITVKCVIQEESHMINYYYDDLKGYAGGISIHKITFILN